MIWIVDNSGPDIVFSKIFKRGDSGWIEIYNWCNTEFRPENWHFWYDSTKADEMAIVANFEILNEQDAVYFQLRWFSDE